MYIAKGKKIYYIKNRWNPSRSLRANNATIHQLNQWKKADEK
jgi:hypothetical protein